MVRLGPPECSSWLPFASVPERLTLCKPPWRCGGATWPVYVSGKSSVLLELYKCLVAKGHTRILYLTFNKTAVSRYVPPRAAGACRAARALPQVSLLLASFFPYGSARSYSCFK